MQGILLAAGFGRRFKDEAKPQQDKLLIRFPKSDKSILWHSANSLITALPNSIAVIQPQQIARKTILQELGFTVIESNRAKEGMGYALADAVSESKHANGWLIALADMPWVDKTLIQKIRQAVILPESVAAPRCNYQEYNNQRGQPVAFGAAWFDALSAIQGDEGARKLLKTANITWVDWYDNSIYRDVDMPSDLSD